MVAASRLDDAHDTGGAERVFLALRDRVVSGELKADDRLPPERELALKFNVSRPLLREALRSLAMLGFLEIIQGSGAYVRQPDIALVSDFLTFCMAQQPDVLDDIIQSRIAIECQAIRLACEKASEADLNRIAASLTSLLDTLDDPVLGGQADYEFHSGIVRASHSPALTTLYRALTPLLMQSHVSRRRIVPSGIRNFLVDAHKEVFLSIVDRKPDEAEKRLREHFAIGDEYRRKSLIAEFSKTSPNKQA